MGPWSHGGWGRSDGDRHGDVELGARTSVFYRHEIELAFFQRHLRAAPTGPTAGAGELPEAYVFETGTNFWARYSAWPPPDATLATLHLRAGGTLSASPPDDATADAAFDAYQSDPSRPVPYTAKLTSELDSDFMSADQRFATRRPDVLSYVSGKLAGDVTLTGPLRARLWVATSGTDADFVVKLVDVYPPDYPDPDPNPGGVKRGGYQQLVRGEVMRGKFRNGFETPEPFTPDTPTSVVLSLPDVSHSFRAGHRIMVQIQSSWFPLIDRNPQRFVDIYQATESDFQTATIRVYRSKDMPSGLEVTARGGLGALR
jgi:putative CocE/NonD family hydrolase